MRGSNGRWVCEHSITHKKCPRCDQVKPLSEFQIKRSGKQTGQPCGYCKPCEIARGNEWRLANRDRFNATQLARIHRNGRCRPMSDNKECSSFLGIHITETILDRYFENITRMPNNNPGYDFICKNGFKIDAKSSCLQQGERGNPRWKFTIRRNSIADYFICLGFDDREDLNPLHVWLIPKDVIGNRHSFNISDNPKIIVKWSKYERPLEKVLLCCDKMRS